MATFFCAIFFVGDITTALLERALDLRMQKHAMHASNIANSNVPDYKAKAMDFEERLREALQQSNAFEEEIPLRSRELLASAAVRAVTADIYTDPFAEMKPNGNTVNSEKEQTELAKNNILFEASIQLINKRFAMQRYVLSGGNN